jgi:HD-GYP domain-containing protein (c-di-GMP phosphodiesterase class II)
MDGRGYPDGLSGDDIPMVARILAVAEVYDALTAPDSYRVPVSAAEAEEEMRRVAGTQLDGRLVFLFLTQVLRHGGSDPDARVADLEAELLAQRRMRDALDEPLVLGPGS